VFTDRKSTLLVSREINLMTELRARIRKEKLIIKMTKDLMVLAAAHSNSQDNSKILNDDSREVD
jgi:hypothetical protein